MMMKKGFQRGLFGVAAIALLTAGAPVAAQKSASRTQATQESSPNRVYCVMFKSVGSRIPKKLCLTKKEWLREGVDIEAEAKAG